MWLFAWLTTLANRGNPTPSAGKASGINTIMKAVSIGRMIGGMTHYRERNLPK